MRIVAFPAPQCIRVHSAFQLEGGLCRISRPRTINRDGTFRNDFSVRDINFTDPVGYTTSQKWLLTFLSLLTVSVVLYFLWPSEDKRIRGLVTDTVKAFETRRSDDVMANVSFTYGDDCGFAYPSLRDFLRQFLQESDDITIEYGGLMMGIVGDKTTATASGSAS